MKAFQFRLDPALRWRTTQLRLEQETTARIAGQIALLQSELTTTYSELRTGSAELALVGSTAFQSWSAYVDRCRRRIVAIDGHLRLTKKALAEQTQKMVDAHQKLRVLENLKSDAFAGWTRELNRETDAFADEAYLAGLFRSSR